jgi:adenylate kinase family enzyme
MTRRRGRMHVIGGRMHVIGGPGSGKTTLARRLADRLHAPMFDLDEIAYPSGQKRGASERIVALEPIVGQSTWITEGIYLWWTRPLLESADVIVWLDVPWRTAALRIVLRHARASLAGTNQHSGMARLARFLASTYRYYTNRALDSPIAADDDGAITRAHTARALADYESKVVRCCTRRDVSRLLE